MKISRFARGAAALMTSFLLLCLCGCDIQELSTLRAFAKPFEGEYRCEYARYGEKDLLESYRAITLSLEGGTFTLTAVPVRGRKKTASGSYGYEGGDTLAFRAKVLGREVRKALPFADGVIFLEQNFAGKKLVMRFKLK